MHSTYSSISSTLSNLNYSQFRSGRSTSLSYQKSPLKFRPVSIEAMDEIIPYLKQEKSRTTDFSYGGLLMWVDYFKYEYCIFNDTLFIKGLVEDNTSLPAFSLPIGKMSIIDSISLLQEYCSEKSIKLVFSAVPSIYLDKFKEFGVSEITELTDWSDYLYDIELLSTFKGKKMSKKRNHVNQFMAAHPNVQVEDLTRLNVGEAIKFMDIYDSEADGAPMELIESALTHKMLEIFKAKETEFEGILLRSNGEVIGFSLGDVKGDTLFVHIEKASRKFNGSYEMVCREFTKRMLEKYPHLKFVNREDDGGDEGLRKSKMSYQPIDLLKKYNVII